MELKGSQTEKNLQRAFSAEAGARTRYELYAAQAKSDGFEQIAAIFTETAGNEMAHAKIWQQYLYGGALGDTRKNLQSAAEGEHYEWSSMYRDFASAARQEGFGEIALRMEQVAAVERDHERRYRTLLQDLSSQSLFESKDGKPVLWICRHCGYVHEGRQAPAVCPVCHYGQAYFERRPENI